MASPQHHAYTVFFEPAQEGGFVAHVPALPGCFSQGETFEEATRNIQDAIAGYIAVLVEDGDEIPYEASDVIVAKIAAPDLA